MLPGTPGRASGCRPRHRRTRACRTRERARPSRSRRPARWPSAVHVRGTRGRWILALVAIGRSLFPGNAPAHPPVPGCPERRRASTRAAPTGSGSRSRREPMAWDGDPSWRRIAARRTTATSPGCAPREAGQPSPTTSVATATARGRDEPGRARRRRQDGSLPGLARPRRLGPRSAFGARAWAASGRSTQLRPRARSPVRSRSAPPARSTCGGCSRRRSSTSASRRRRETHSSRGWASTTCATLLSSWARSP